MIFHYFTTILISDHQCFFLPFFWRYISFFRYLLIMFIYNCFWIISELLIVSELFLNCGKLFETFVILSAILLPIEPVASAVFWITFFEVVLSASVADYLAWLISFWLYLPIKFLLKFLPIFLPMLFAKDKNS